MSKLLTAGCSFTFYSWPTWADYLAGNFTEYLNKGIPGADNATIARIVCAMAEPDDTVVVMWSGYQRYNYGIVYADTYNYSKNHQGSGIFDDRYYVTKIYNQYERFVTTLDYMALVHADSQLRGYVLHQFTAFPVLAGELESPVSADMLAKLDEKQYIIDSVNPVDLYSFASDYDFTPGDSHPTPISHYDYCAQIICPAMGIDQLLTPRDRAITDTEKL